MASQDKQNQQNQQARQDPQGVFAYVGNRILPSTLARGPWSPDAQHGGAPAGLLAAIAERAMADEPGWSMVRLTLELLRPVPIAPLQATHEIQPGGSVRRVALSLMHDDKPVVRGVAVFMRERAVDLMPAATDCPLPLPDQCSEPIRIPGMAEQTSFHYTAMESRVAAGSVAAPGPAAAWFRFAVPLIDGWPTPASARAAAAADFGNGISWALPLDRFVFANADLTVSLHRQPQGEWVGVDSVTVAQPSGIGLTTSTLYDEAGAIGVAQQSLLIKQR